MKHFRIILALMLFGILLAACGGAPAEPAEEPEEAEEPAEAEEAAEEEMEEPAEEEMMEEVTIVDWGFTGGIQDMFRQFHAEPFMEANPGVTVELLGGISEDAIAQIKAAQGASPYDTMLLGEPRYLQAQREGWILPVTADDIPNAADVYPNIQEKCEPAAVAWTVELIGVVYNPDLVPAPESWDDLFTNPVYEGQIGMASPSSNAGYLFMMTLGNLYGEGESDVDAIWAKLDEMQPFVVAANPETLGQLLEREEIGIAINWATEAAVTIDKGFGVEFTLPEPGGIGQVGCYGVLADTAHPELAKEYVNAALSVEFQTAMSQPPYFFAPVNSNVEISEESAVILPTADQYPNLLTVNQEVAIELREELTDEFIRRYGQ